MVRIDRQADAFRCIAFCRPLRLGGEYQFVRPQVLYIDRAVQYRRGGESQDLWAYDKTTRQPAGIAQGLVLKTPDT